MRLLIVFSSVLIFYFIYGFYISQIDVQIIPQKLSKANTDEYYDYNGVLNVHSHLSLGSGSVQQIVSAARSAGQDFVFLTDLNYFEIPYALEGYIGSTLLFTGGKYSYLDSRLLFYSPKDFHLGDKIGEVQTALADLLSQKPGYAQDQLLILAHPFKSGFSWSGEIPTNLDGLEVVNLKSLSLRAWESSKLSVIWSLLIYPFNSKLALVRLFNEPTEDISLFDQISEQRRFFLYSGAEASARAAPLPHVYLRFPSYQKNFELFSNHILLKSELTGHFKNDKLKIFSALKNGQFYVSFDLLGDPKGFTAFLEDGRKNHPMGSQVRFSKNLFLRAQIPTAPSDFFEVVVYRNGLRYETVNDAELRLPITEPGTYRIQVRVSPYLPLPDGKKWITWIYTNPFFIRE